MVVRVIGKVSGTDELFVKWNVPGDCSCEVCPFGNDQKYLVKLGCGAAYKAFSETVIESQADEPLFP